MYIGRMLPNILKQAGFKKISWSIHPMIFQNQELENEYKQFIERFKFIKPHLEKILKDNTSQFIKTYLKEMRIPENVLFYNKFIVKGHA